MSPELADNGAVDPRSDLFSLGSVMYFMLTGHPPFRAQSMMAILNRICHSAHRPVEQVNTEVPYEMARLIDKLLAKDPADRVPTAVELDSELTKLLSLLQQGQLSLRAPAKESNDTDVKPFRWIPFMVSVVGLILLIAVSGKYFLQKGSSIPLERSEAFLSGELAAETPSDLVDQANATQQVVSVETDWQDSVNHVHTQALQLRKKWTLQPSPTQDEFFRKSAQLQDSLRQLLTEPTIPDRHSRTR
jgi:serine/threonine protein kinase